MRSSHPVDAPIEDLVSGNMSAMKSVRLGPRLSEKTGQDMASEVERPSMCKSEAKEFQFYRE